MRRGVRYCADQGIIININTFNPSADPNDSSGYDTDRQFEIGIDWNSEDIQTALPYTLACDCGAETVCDAATCCGMGLYLFCC